MVLLPPGIQASDSSLQILNRTDKSQSQPVTPRITETGSRGQRHTAMQQQLS